MNRAEPSSTGDVVVACTAAQKRWVLVVAVLGSSLAFIDGTVVNVALPAIQRELDASVYQAQWVMEAYALFLASLLLLGGSLSDRLGRRRIFLMGVVVFAAASLACALSATAGQLISARAVQGAGAALLVPGSMALITTYFTPQERGRAFGLWTGFSSAATAAGPILGGVLIDRVSWTWAFAVNLPVALVVVVITWLHVPRAEASRSPAPLDIAGSACATLALAGLAFGFTEAPARGWGATEVLAAFALGIVASVALVLVERRSRAPMIPPAFLRNRTFVGVNLLTLLLYGALGGGLFFLPLNLVQVQGLPATAAGAALLPFVAILFVLSRWSGGLVTRHGARLPLVAGPAIAGAGFAWLALPGMDASYWTGFLPGIAVLGLGMAITIAPLTTTVMAVVDPAAAGVASGINNAVSRVAGLLAIALFGGLMAAAFEPRLQSGLEASGLQRHAVERLWSHRDKLAALQPPADAPREVAERVTDAVHAAFVAGYRWIMGASAILAVAAAAIAALTVAPDAGCGSGTMRVSPPAQGCGRKDRR